MALYTEFSWMTEEELVHTVEADPGASPMERELCSRLIDALDALQEQDRLADAVGHCGADTLEARIYSFKPVPVWDGVCRRAKTGT